MMKAPALCRQTKGGGFLMPPLRRVEVGLSNAPYLSIREYK
jgi:hypothetical protein